MTEVIGNVGKKNLVHSGQTGLRHPDFTAAQFIPDGIQVPGHPAVALGSDETAMGEDHTRVRGAATVDAAVRIAACLMALSSTLWAQDARAQLEEFDKQMAEMPESQRNMMMNMMGEQIEMMRKMAAGDQPDAAEVFELMDGCDRVVSF